MYGYVYIIRNKINQKIYVGQHKHDKPELDTTYEGSGIILQKAYQKYGKQNFQCELIDIASSKQELDKLEIECIHRYRQLLGVHNVYNIADGGQGGACYPMTQLRRDKISKALRGRKIDPEVVKKRANAQRGRVVSEETRQKSRISNTGQKRSAEARLHMSQNHADVNGVKNPFFGKHHTEETKAKLREHNLRQNCNKRWITNGVVTRYVDVSEVDTYLKSGYRYGRSDLSRRSTTIPEKEVGTK